jgi:uncharacterized membrane protein
MGIVLGLAAALLYGGADFAGGLLSRRVPSLSVAVIGSIASAAIAWLALGVTGTAPTAGSVAWGSIAGLGGGVGTIALYRGLARGQMSVVGPVSAVGSAVLPVVVGIGLGERPSLIAAAGLVVALPAIGLVSAGGSGPAGALRTSLIDGLYAGVSFGVMFVGLAQAGDQAGLWPVASEQTVSLVVLAILALRSRAIIGLRVRALGLPIVIGVASMAATLCYFAASQSGLLATVAVVTSLYPGVTVALARVVLHERFSAPQRTGLGMCAIAIVAIALN